MVITPTYKGSVLIFLFMSFISTVLLEFIILVIFFFHFCYLGLISVSLRWLKRNGGRLHMVRDLPLGFRAWSETAKNKASN